MKVTVKDSPRISHVKTFGEMKPGFLYRKDDAGTSKRFDYYVRLGKGVWNQDTGIFVMRICGDGSNETFREARSKKITGKMYLVGPCEMTVQLKN